ncbi:hypothetical protein E2C01_078513 [Portunus trituberculatus]|uniref:Secreted protein n=1 Tax=Portunus trituberculatus TaxID=210409 RepID=A0A5B7IQD6_PORTR|nr:hypothetical protein [Portunus trituberculatus]
MPHSPLLLTLLSSPLYARCMCGQKGFRIGACSELGINLNHCGTEGTEKHEIQGLNYETLRRTSGTSKRF